MDPASQMLLMESSNNSINQDYSNMPIWAQMILLLLLGIVTVGIMYLLVLMVKEALTSN